MLTKSSLLAAGAACVTALAFAGVANAGTSIQPLVARGTGTFHSAPPASPQKPSLPLKGEFRTGIEPDLGAAAAPLLGTTTLSVPNVSPSSVSQGSPALTFDGLAGVDQRYADGGNQFSVEPPDQGLCAGNGYIVEPINDVIGVYDQSSGSLLGWESLNQFYGYPHQYDRSTRTIGPQVTDPECLFDPASGKFIVDVLTYEVDAEGNPTGANHIDLAVSDTGDPRGSWHFYSFQAADDGTFGTPVHPNCPCLGDYPHVGLDAYGYYVTTNEYPWFVDGFNGAQLYAISKQALTSGAMSINVVHYDDLTAAGNPGFTLAPAHANPSDYDLGSGGTEWFLSSMATPEANNSSGIDNRVAVWALRHTSLLAAGGVPDLSNQVFQTETYAIPPASDQMATAESNLPLLSCLNDKTPLALFGGLSCSEAVTGIPGGDPYAETQGVLDSNDSRMLQTWLVNGWLVGSLDTAVNVSGEQRAGVAWFGFKLFFGHPLFHTQGYLAVANNNIIYPAMAARSNGTGVMAVTLTGENYFPSAAYLTFTISVKGPVFGNVQLAANGVGPQDGFTEYDVFSPYGNGVPRPRWGDYGGATSDGNSLIFASEYIGQSCTYSQWLDSGLVCPDFSRGALINWGTRISELH